MADITTQRLEALEARITSVEQAVGALRAAEPNREHAESARQANLLVAAKASGCPWPPTAQRLGLILAGRDWRDATTTD